MIFLSKEKLEQLSTKRLLAYKNSLMKYPDGPNEDGSGMNKSFESWKITYNLIKEILSKREHIEKT